LIRKHSRAAVIANPARIVILIKHNHRLTTQPQINVQMNSSSGRLTRFLNWTGLLVILAAFAGCSSLDKPSSASFASVVIINHTPAQIKANATIVFEQYGYQLVGKIGDDLVFQRDATRGETISYAGLVGAHEGAMIVMRVRVNVLQKDANSYWLSCKAFAVSNPGQPVFENSTPLFHFQNGPYQKLLDQVLADLPATASTTNP
jgi:hypothetical protein